MDTLHETAVRLPLTVPHEPVSPGRGGVGGVTPAMIAAVVDDFYAACRMDPSLGPIFDRHVKEWGPHLARIEAFWRSVLLRTGEYAGRPLEAHLMIPDLTTEHFAIWLRLFAQSVHRHCPPGEGGAEVAAAFMEFAGRMARNMIALGAIGRRPSGCPVRGTLDGGADAPLRV